jgi:defect-in-organelle-trafficking protein DotA
MNDPSGDPIYKIQVLGNTMLDSALQLWISGALILGLMVGAVTVFSTVFNLGYAIEAALKLLVPVFVLLIGALFVSGYVFAVYIPLIPYLIFTFAAIGWLISVLEAVVAAPLVAAHITHPEGHDLLGKAEQAVILMMGVFLRPVVMIIGFLAAMVMSHVILRIINAGFGHVIMSSRVTSGDGEAVWLISIIGVIVIYTTTVVSLINLIYNAGIVKLWETIWMWVGFHQQAGAGAAVDHAMQEIRGAVQSTGKGFGDAGNEGFKGGVDAGAGLGRDAGNAASKVGSAGLDIGLAAYKGSNFKMKKGETQLSDTSAPHGKEEMGS